MSVYTIQDIISLIALAIFCPLFLWLWVDQKRQDRRSKLRRQQKQEVQHQKDQE